MSDAHASEGTFSPQQAEVISELQAIATTAAELSTALNGVIETTAPGGKLYETQQAALQRMAKWEAFTASATAATAVAAPTGDGDGDGSGAGPA